MNRVSRQTVAAVDASKLEQRRLSVITPVQNLRKVITGSSAPADIIEACCDAGVQGKLT